MKRHRFTNLFNLKGVLIFLVTLLCSFPIVAATSPSGKSYEVFENGIYYSLKSDDTYCVVDADYTENLIVPETVQGKSVTEIADSAFKGRIDIESVETGAGLKRIGNSAFQSCEALESLLMENSVGVEICYLAFDSSSLKGELTLPDEVVLNRMSFSYIPIENLNIPGSFSLTSSADCVFFGCPYLKSVYIGSCSAIAQKMFYNNPLLETVRIGDGCISIRKEAFRECARLNKVENISASLRTIGYGAFYNCTSLSHFDFIEGLKTIDDYAFYNTKLEEFRYPSTFVHNLYAGQPKLISEFLGTIPNLKRIYYPDLEYFFNYPPAIKQNDVGGVDVYIDNNLLTELLLPASAVSIRSYSFANIASIQKVIIPNMTQSANYESKAFASCVNLEQVEIGAGKSVFGGGNFKGCENLKSIHISDKNKCETIPADFAYNCSSLTDVSISKVTSIGRDAFYNTGIEEVDWPSVTVAESGCFRSCQNLIKVSLPNISKLEGRIINDCLKLEEVFLPNVIEASGDLGKCPMLRKLELPRVKKLSNLDLSYCESLDSLEFPVLDIWEQNSYSSMPPNLKFVDIPMVEEIPVSAFKNLEKLETVNIPLIRTIPSSAFQGCRSLKDFNFINIISIEIFGFYGCDSLREVYLPVIENLGEWAFGNCNGIETLYLGENLDELTYRVFEGCSGIKSAQIMGDLKKMTSAFEGAFSPDKSFIEFHGKIEQFENRIFSGTGINTVIFHKDIPSILPSMFSNCSSLKTLVFKGEIGGFGEKAFDKCPSLSEVKISKLDNWLSLSCGTDGNPGALNSTPIKLYLLENFEEKLIDSLKLEVGTSIRPEAFRNINLESLSIADGEEYEIGARAFMNSALKNVNLGVGLTSLGENAFNGNFFTELILPSTLTSVGAGALQLNENLANVILPSSLESTSNGFLWANKNLEYLILPEGMTNIAQGLTSLYSHMRFISLPSSIKKLSVQSLASFCYLNSNVEFYCWADEAPWAPREDFSNVAVHVKPQALNSYKSSQAWSKAILIPDLSDEFSVIWDGESLSVNCPEMEIDDDVLAKKFIIRISEIDDSTGEKIEVGTFYYPENPEANNISDNRGRKAQNIPEFDGLHNYTYDLEGYSSNGSLVHKSNGILSNVTTSVKEIECEENVRYFDILGRQINNPTNGVYIRNGKKILK